MTFLIVCLYYQNYKLLLNCEISIFGENVIFGKMVFKKFKYILHAPLSIVLKHTMGHLLF